MKLLSRFRRLLVIDGGERDAIASRKMRRAKNIRRNDAADLGVASRSLAIGAQNDGLAVAGNLDRAGSRAVEPVRATSARVGERGVMPLDSRHGASVSSRK